MSEEATQSETADASVETDQSTTEKTTATVDLDSAAEVEERLRALEETAERQRERIEHLDGLVLDLSTRVADGRDIGVCPDCNGPLRRLNRFIRSDTIECGDCGKVVYTY